MKKAFSMAGKVLLYGLEGILFTIALVPCVITVVCSVIMEKIVETIETL